MNKTTPKLPGTGMRILSFVPVVNCFVMIYLGISYADKLTLILGGAYFFNFSDFPGCFAADLACRCDSLYHFLSEN